jgi:cell division protein FtsW (lipid II flippase)
MNIWSKVTRWLIILTIVIWIIWDVIAIYSGGYHATESSTVRNWGNLHPWFAWMVGGLMGHFFFNVGKRFRSNPDWVPTVVMPTVAAALLALDLSHLLPHMNPVIPLIVGIVSGRLMWPQKEVTTDATK